MTCINMTFGSVDCFFLLTCELQNQRTGQDRVRTWKLMLPILSLYPWHMDTLVMRLKLVNMEDVGPYMSSLNCGINMTMTRSQLSIHAWIVTHGHWGMFHQQVSLRESLRQYHREFPSSPHIKLSYFLSLQLQENIGQVFMNIILINHMPKHTHLNFLPQLDISYIISWSQFMRSCLW